jgi:hypothetical protein
MSKFVDSVGHRTGVIGLPDAGGASYQADVNSAGDLLVAVATSTGGVLNATGQVSVANTATLIIAANTRQGVLITNPSTTVTVYIGGSGVTTGNGQALLPGCSLTLPIVGAVYGIVATSTQTVSYVEVV